MSAAEFDPKSAPACRECGASNDPGASECWLCHSRAWRGRSPKVPEPDPSRTDDDLFPKIALAALAMVVLGGVAIAPGLVITLMVIVLPPWAGAEWIAHRRRNRGLPTSTARKVAWIVSLAILLPVLAYAVIIAIVLVCWALTGGPNIH